jgi:hypothetical protein
MYHIHMVYHLVTWQGQSKSIKYFNFRIFRVMVKENFRSLSRRPQIAPRFKMTNHTLGINLKLCDNIRDSQRLKGMPHTLSLSIHLNKTPVTDCNRFLPAFCINTITWNTRLCNIILEVCDNDLFFIIKLLCWIMK